MSHKKRRPRTAKDRLMIYNRKFLLASVSDIAYRPALSSSRQHCMASTRLIIVQAPQAYKSMTISPPPINPASKPGIGG